MSEDGFVLQLSQAQWSDMRQALLQATPISINSESSAMPYGFDLLMDLPKPQITTIKKTELLSSEQDIQRSIGSVQLSDSIFSIQSAVEAAMKPYHFAGDVFLRISFFPNRKPELQILQTQFVDDRMTADMSEAIFQSLPDIFVREGSAKIQLHFSIQP